MAPVNAPRSVVWRWLRRAVLVVVVLVVLPYLLAPIYLVVTPVSTLMLWRYATGQRVARTYIALDAMPAIMPRSVIVAEDAHFCRHHGVDWGELRAALREAPDFATARGGSTITQQVAKNLFLWPGRSVVRKVLELPLALWLDLIFPKRRLMEIYLNIAEWGPAGEFGAEAGARRAFGKSVRTIAAHEAALLAAILPNPLVRSAQRPGPSVRRLAGVYAGRALISHADDCLSPSRRR